jgi:hypothetical protein
MRRVALGAVIVAIVVGALVALRPRATAPERASTPAAPALQPGDARSSTRSARVAPGGSSTEEATEEATAVEVAALRVLADALGEQVVSCPYPADLPRDPRDAEIVDGVLHAVRPRTPGATRLDSRACTSPLGGQCGRAEGDDGPEAVLRWDAHGGCSVGEPVWRDVPLQLDLPGGATPTSVLVMGCGSTQRATIEQGVARVQALDGVACKVDLLVMGSPSLFGSATLGGAVVKVAPWSEGQEGGEPPSAEAQRDHLASVQRPLDRALATPNLPDDVRETLQAWLDHELDEVAARQATREALEDQVFRRTPR